MNGKVLTSVNQDDVVDTTESTEKIQHVKDVLERLQLSKDQDVQFMFVDGVLKIISTGKEHWKVGTMQDTVMIYSFKGDIAAFNLNVTGVKQ